MVAKETCGLPCLIGNRTQLILGQATEPMGGVGGQLGPGGVVTVTPGSGTLPLWVGARALESDRLKFRSLLLCPWMRQAISLNRNFFICEVGIIMIVKMK